MLCITTGCSQTLHPAGLGTLGWVTLLGISFFFCVAPWRLPSPTLQGWNTPEVLWRYLGLFLTSIFNIWWSFAGTSLTGIGELSSWHICAQTTATTTAGWICLPRLLCLAFLLCLMAGNPAVPPSGCAGKSEICREGNHRTGWLWFLQSMFWGVLPAAASPCHIIYICAQCVLPWLQEQKAAGMDGWQCIALLLKLGLFLLGLLHWK